MEWVKVEDDLPDEGVWVLVHIKGYVIETAMYSELSQEFQNGYEWLEGVTHWIPLPEPPKD